MTYRLQFEGLDGKLPGSAHKYGDQAERVEYACLDIRQEGMLAKGLRVSKGQVSGQQMPRFEDPENVEPVGEVPAGEVASILSPEGVVIRQKKSPQKTATSTTAALPELSLLHGGLAKMASSLPLGHRLSYLPLSRLKRIRKTSSP